jgi:hypothetical protein
MPQATPETTPSNLIDHLADEILALINSKPRSPTKSELLAILGATPPAVQEVIDLWQRLGVLSEIEGTSRNAEVEREESEILDRIEEIAEEAWDREPKTLGDLALRSALACAYGYYDREGDHDNLEDFVSLGEKAEAEVLQATAQLFCPQFRLPE